MARAGVALALAQFALAWVAAGAANAIGGNLFRAIELPQTQGGFDSLVGANALFCVLGGVMQGITARRIVLEWHWRRYSPARARCLGAGAFYLAVGAAWFYFSLLAAAAAPPRPNVWLCVERDFFAAALTLWLPALGFFLVSFGFSRVRDGAVKAEF